MKRREGGLKFGKTGDNFSYKKKCSTFVGNYLAAITFAEFRKLRIYAKFVINDIHQNNIYCKRKLDTTMIFIVDNFL